VLFLAPAQGRSRGGIGQAWNVESDRDQQSDALRPRRAALLFLADRERYTGIGTMQTLRWLHIPAHCDP